jgi:hypothetical protein
MDGYIFVHEPRELSNYHSMQVLLNLMQTSTVPLHYITHDNLLEYR